VTADRDAHELPRLADLDSDYEIVRELGRGGMAVVYLAMERQLGRRVAIKVIRASYLEDEQAAARLEREAQTVARLQHPNIVMLYGIRRLRDHSLALVMQYVPGGTLESEIRAWSPLPLDRVEQILTDMGGALSYAHHNRIVHRDIKPANIYVDDETGSARLSDFGIARPWDATQGLTLPGMAIGTPAYMSPEQIDGRSLDGRSDLYSLGLVAYEMLTGCRPWAGENLFSIVYKQKHETLPDLDTLRPGLPGRLRYALHGMLRKDREERWNNADEFLTVLRGEVPLPTRWGGAAANPESAIGAALLPGSETVPYRRDVLTTPPSNPRSDGGLFVPPDTSPPEQAAAKSTQDPNPAGPDAEDILAKVVGLLEAQAPGPGRPSVPIDDITREYVKPFAWIRRGSAIAAAAIVFLILISAGQFLMSKRGGPDDTSRTNTVPVEPEVGVGLSPVAVPSTRPPLARAINASLYGLAGDTVYEPLVLKVQDQAGKPVAGVAVRFEISKGEGQVEPATTVTDTAGTARTRWFLRTPGLHVLIASVPELALNTTFQAQAFPRPPAPVAPALPVARAPTPEPEATSSSNAKAVEEQGAPAERARTQPNSPAVTRLPIRSGVSAGGTHTCVLNGEGVAVCWGGNDRGQLGDGSASRKNGVVAVAAAEPLSVLSTGVSHTCGVSVSGVAYCWGSNSAGQLGDGTRADRVQPTRLASVVPIVRVFAGMSHSCGLDADGRLYCWGENTDGQLGDGTHSDRTEPVRVAGAHAFRSVALGWAHTCALTRDGTAFCWGRNEAGELGDGSNADQSRPAPVSGGSRFTSIAAGSRHTCGLTANGSVHCWGENSQGQLGNDVTEDSRVPVVVPSIELADTIALGSVHSCALTRDGTAYCWGGNTYGQLGGGTTQSRLRPAPVAGAQRFRSLSTSGAHTCGVTAGASFCWGYNINGQLGDGTRVNQTRPVTVIRR
jgi:serine/threonine protein kinase/alpha-tubulin suppressor-like RCC1 family protein